MFGTLSPFSRISYWKSLLLDFGEKGIYNFLARIIRNGQQIFIRKEPMSVPHNASQRLLRMRDKIKINEPLAYLGRRQFLIGTCLMAFGLLGQANEVESLARALLSNPGEARQIGRLYLAQFPTESSLATLTRHLELTTMYGLNREVIRSRIRQQIGADFEQGNTVNLAGWILARTEARVCALTVAA